MLSSAKARPTGMRFPQAANSVHRGVECAARAWQLFIKTKGPLSRARGVRVKEI
jgi:hypothetical protein